MTDYRPPLRDIKFVLEHVVGLDDIAALPDFEHVDRDLSFTVLDEAGRFMADRIAPTNQVGDAEGAIHHDDGRVTLPKEIRSAYQEYVAAGWNAVKAPMEYGGHGFPTSVGIGVMEMLTTANMAFSLCPMLTASAILALQHHGTEEQKAIYLEKLISGEWTGTMDLTEPQAGSDVGALTTKAEPQDDGTYRITGTKIFITWGEHDVADNIIHLVLARTPGAPPGTKGISLFIVPKYLVNADGSIGERNDVNCVSIEHKIGIHASPTCVLSYGDNAGAVGYLVGAENQGMRAMFTMMNDARLHVGLEGLGVAERSYQQALEYAQERRQGRAIGAPKTESSPIIDHPDVRRMLMTMKANIEAMRALMYDNAAALDWAEHGVDDEQRQRGAARAALLTPLAKGWGTDLGVELTSIGIQIHGGMGYVEETGSAQIWRDSRIAPIYEGTNGIQAIDLVLRKLPMDGGKVVASYFDEIDALDGPLGAAGLDSIRERLAAGLAVLRKATDWIGSRDDVNDALAAATPYARMFGIVAGGYYMAKAALAAHSALGSANGDAGFYAAKVTTAQFYAEQILPQADGLLAASTAPSDSLFAIEPEALRG
ncbi:MAG: acyl-CoA dehydrogenase C-terminal domain-containing protein [Acidimicrobiia bacterium]|nr:acyl-CoA dehydrogenase C-terminal domain-containing protein [Acidimicrobiia bacterium]